MLGGGGLLFGLMVLGLMVRLHSIAFFFVRAYAMFRSWPHGRHWNPRYTCLLNSASNDALPSPAPSSIDIPSGIAVRVPDTLIYK